MSNEDFSENVHLTGREPAFDFRNLPSSNRLMYQLLDWDNYVQLYHLFKNDLNAFVDERFKSLGDLQQYVQYQMEYALYSSKRGGCDWFFLKDGQYAGVLHLYDLTHDQSHGKHQHCTIGFATAEPHRKQGLTQEAIRHLLTYLFDSFHMQQVLSYTHQENVAAIALLKSLGFKNCDEEYHLDESSCLYRYFRMRKEWFGIE